MNAARNFRLNGSNGLNGQAIVNISYLEQLGFLGLAIIISLVASSCGMPAQAAGTQAPPPNSLALRGNLPPASINQAYNAVLSVGGGSSPYHFSVKTGDLPPGVSLNPTTGRLSGTPKTSGDYSFEVIVTDAPRLDQGSHMFQVLVAGNSSNNGVSISVNPGNATIVSAAKHQFLATVQGTANTGVRWSASAGSISSSGLYTAPVVTSVATTVVTATSVADTSKSASATITLSPGTITNLTISTASLAGATRGSAYNATLAANGGTAPYKWNVTSGNLPGGISIDNSGTISGVPSATGTFNFALAVADASGKIATSNLSIAVASASNGGFDGPAELPRVTVSSKMSDSPAPGSIISVNAGGNLQAALDNAKCGDTISLQAGATFSGQFNVRAKGCDDSHWIIIRTSGPDSALPAEGQRATPCYAGVHSLPGRPQYSCSNGQNVMARVQNNVLGNGPFKLESGANFYRFIGLEITRAAGTAASAQLISVKGTANHIIVDRSWLHGLLQDETQLGVSLSGMSYVAVVDSYFSDFHCISVTGSCTDAHAVAGGLGSSQDGPFKIQNNFLEASGESVIFGGGAATTTPTDIEIVGNHFWKPWQWMPGQPGFVGGANGRPFIVKNHLELKNAMRVLIDGNLMENAWGGFSQSGFSILLTPKNQHTSSGDVCPVCQVTDVTVRNGRISHVGGGIQMATAVSGNGTNGSMAAAGARWSIHDIILDDVSRKYVGGGSLFLIMNVWTRNAIHSVSINHVTGFPDPESHVLDIGNIYYTSAPMYGFVFTNNMVGTGRYPVWNTGGTGSCSYADVPLTTLQKCFTTYTFANNALVDNPSAFPVSVWPANNLYPQSGNAGFMDYSAGNYELVTGSLYKNKGTDGKDLGADVAAVAAALANVE